jgi:hypothetical protein
LSTRFFLFAVAAPVAVFVACQPQNQQAQQPYPQYPQQGYAYPQQQPYPQQQQPQGYPTQPAPYPTQSPPQATPTQQAPYPTAPYPTAPQPTQTAPAPTAPAPTAAPTTPSPFPFPMPSGTSAPSGSAATPIDPNFAAVATGPLFVYAQSEAPGMTRVGTVVAAQFAQGQILETPVTLQPNKCYAVLAVGVGIQTVDIMLVLTTPIPGMNPTLARDSGGGTQASLGGKGRCFTWPAPIAGQAKFVITATSGQGIAAGQMYVK